jgi:predicted nucleic acid-binding protein
VILLDTNVLIDARYKRSPFHAWAEQVIAEGLAAQGAALNAVVLAELCVGHDDPSSIQVDLSAQGLSIVDIPVAASILCARAYSRYRLTRKESGGGDAPRIPLPDFFIGSHAELMGWRLATRDPERFRLYFSDVDLIEPPGVEPMKR